MLLALPVALLALALPSGDLYSKVGELKEPDWSEPTEAEIYFKLDDLKVPEWAQDPEPEAYTKLDDLKDPY